MPMVVQAVGDGGVVAPQVLALVAARQVGGREGLEADEEAAEPGRGGFLDQVAAQDRIDGGRALEQPAHPAHAVEERRGESHVAEQVVVEKVQVPARQSIDFGEGVVHPLGIEGSAALEERVLVAEVAVLRTAAGDDDRVRDEVRAAADQIATDRRHALERPPGRRDIAALRALVAKVVEELREGLLARSEEDRVGVRGRFVGQ